MKNQGYHSFFLLFVFLTFLLALPCFSLAKTESVSEEDIMEMSLDQLMDVSIVTASKKEQRISEVAGSAFIIKREDIERYGYRTLGDALRQITGLYISNDRNYMYLGVRGFSLPSDYGTKILLLVDGHRVNGELYDQGNVGAFFPIDIENIERIEVVKGPGSAIWGTNALLAVVNVITRKGKDIDGARVLAEYGSHDHKKGYLEYGKEYGNDFEVKVSISGFETDGEGTVHLTEFEDPAVNPLADNDGNSVGEDEEYAYYANIILSYKEFEFFFIKSRRNKRVPTAPWEGVFMDTIGDGLNTYDDAEILGLRYDQKFLEDKNGQLFVKVYHNSNDYYGEYPFYDTFDPTGNYVDNIDKGKAKHWGAEISASIDAASILSLTGGIEYKDTYELMQENYDAEPFFATVLPATDNSYTVWSYFLQADVDILKNLRFVTGLRLDDYSTFGEHWSPRAALLYSPWLATTFKLLYGEAFRAPNDYERNYDDGGWQFGNQDLDPEVIKTYEFVVEQNIGNHTRLVASIFRFDLKDMISAVDVGGGAFQFQNTGKTRSDGIEIQVESEFNNVKGYFGVTYADTKDEDTNSHLTNSPRLTATGGISIPVFSEKLYVSPDVRFVDERETLSGTDVDSYYLTDLSIVSGKIFSRLKASFTIYNLFDEFIVDPGGAEHYYYNAILDDYPFYNIPQDGRTFRFQLSYQF